MKTITENTFEKFLSQRGEQGLYGEKVSMIQVNLGLRCNLQCAHCHVAAGPWRKEEMDWETMEFVLSAVKKIDCQQMDITGGAPELNPHFRPFIKALRAMNIPVIVRTNLTVLLEKEMEGTAEFMGDQKVGLVASLPCYLEENVDHQRGDGVYSESIQVLKLLNSLGYGRQDDLPLHLVYNPLGPQLPPPQANLEADYKQELFQRFQIEFTGLYTITNMPIGRFWGDLKKAGKNGEYMTTLKDHFNLQTVPGLMCRHQINVRWDGTLFDCDFNLALKMPVSESLPRHIRDFDPHLLDRRKIATANHCFGCTAGCGSSCGGSLVE